MRDSRRRQHRLQFLQGGADVRATAKFKGNFAKKVSIYVNGQVIPYGQLLPKDIQSYEPPKNEYYYLYVPADCDKSAIIKGLKEEYL